MVPWSFRRQLVCDVTTPDTFAPPYIVSATSEAGAVAAQAEERKKAKYISLAAPYSFCLIAIETSGVLGPQTAILIRDLGSRLREITGENKAHVYLL